MKYPFTTKKIDVTKEVWYDEFCFPGGFVEHIEMKCVKCDFEIELDADIIFECFNSRKEDYPELYCSNCNKPFLVPKDIYEQVKGGFYYPFNETETF